MIYKGYFYLHTLIFSFYVYRIFPFPSYTSSTTHINLHGKIYIVFGHVNGSSEPIALASFVINGRSRYPQHTQNGMTKKSLTTNGNSGMLNVKIFMKMFITYHAQPKKSKMADITGISTLDGCGSSTFTISSP